MPVEVSHAQEVGSPEVGASAEDGFLIGGRLIMGLLGSEVKGTINASSQSLPLKRGLVLDTKVVSFKRDLGSGSHHPGGFTLMLLKVGIFKWFWIVLAKPVTPRRIVHHAFRASYGPRSRPKANHYGLRSRSSRGHCIWRGRHGSSRF